MRKLLAVVLLAVGSLSAQTAETIPFRAIMLASNEVPAVPLEASGTATIWLHVVRDAQGRVTSASTDFNINFTLPAANRVVGLHIHSGAAGANGPVLIDTGITSGAPLEVSTTGRITAQAQTLSTNTAGLEAVNGVLTNPSGYYVNMHTADFPGGVIRGQLQQADMVVLGGIMSPQNEVPPIEGLAASAVGTIVALRTRDASGTPTSGLVIFDANYRGFTEGTSFTGFHIHSGPAGVNAPVTINTGIGAGPNSVAAAPAGANLHYEVEVPMGAAAAVQTLQGLFTNPGDFYINLHTVVNPGGAIRSQLRRTDRISFPVSMSPANEVPPITNAEAGASAPAAVTAHTIRNADGTVAGGVVIFDINHRFPATATFRGLHIHDGPAGMNGGVTIDTGLSATQSVVSQTGFGNIYRIVTVSTEAGLRTLNSLVSNPENHYVNLHTELNSGGAVRSQLAAPVTALPVITAVSSPINDPATRNVAPGGLTTISGTNLAKVTSDLLASSNGVMLPAGFNGTSVTIGGRPAPLLIVAPANVVVQVPTDVPAGPQPVAVRNANGAAAATMNITVAATAPAVFFDANGGIFQKNSDFSLVTANNRARAADIILVYSTGLGATTPALSSGQITPLPGTAGTFYNTGAATVTVGGREARVIYSLASPGFGGLYQTAFEVPTGVAAGNVPVVLRVGGVASNSVNIAVQ
jgi:uncharacterized protein (TIGR03437 family)